MCLLIAGTASQIRTTLLTTEGLMADIFSSNSDGIGTMYAEGGVLYTKKLVPKNLGEFIEFIKAMPDDDRQLACHMRYKTHGDTDLENCHPYDVIDGIALMHNGILSQGNSADKTKSDTWHYIKDVVRPMLEEAPAMFTNKAWLELVENDIGNGNRFAIMDSEGNMSILNKHTGIDVKGMWFSNTYAWSPELLIEGYKKAGKAKHGWGSYLDYDDDKEYDNWPVRRLTTASRDGVTDAEYTTSSAFKLTEKDVLDAAYDSSPILLAGMLADRPRFVLDTIFDDAYLTANDRYDYDDDECDILELLEAGDAHKLAKMIYDDKSPACDEVAGLIADCICWYCHAHGKPINEKGTAAVLKAAEDEVEEAVREFELANRAALAEIDEAEAKDRATA